MKKIITLGVFVIILIMSCTLEYKDTKLDRNSRVPISIQDSTKWHTVQLYESMDGKTIYIKENKKEIHKIDVIASRETAFIIFSLTTLVIL